MWGIPPSWQQLCETVSAGMNDSARLKLEHGSRLQGQNIIIHVVVGVILNLLTVASFISSKLTGFTAMGISICIGVSKILKF